MAHNRCLRWGWKEGREPRHIQSPNFACPGFMCSKDIPAPCPLLAALRRMFLSCSSHIPEGWGVTIWGRAALAVSGQSSNIFHFLGIISMIWGLGFFFCGEEPQVRVGIQCQLREYTCSLNIGILPQWSLVSHKLWVMDSWVSWQVNEFGLFLGSGYTS